MNQPALDNYTFKQITDSNWMAIVYANLDGNIIYNNPASEKLYGYCANELMGKHVSIFHHKKEEALEILSTTFHDGGWSGEVEQERKDGSTFTAFLTVSKVYNCEGNHVGFTGNARDISTQKEERKQLKESEKLMNSFVDAIPFGIYITDYQGKTVYSNNFAKEFVKTLSQENESYDVHSVGAWKAFYPGTNEEIPVEKLPISSALKGIEGRSMEIDLEILGQRCPLRGKSKPIFDQDGKLKLVVTTFEDISEFNKQKNELLQKESQISAIINNTDATIFSIDCDYQILEHNNIFKERLERVLGPLELKGKSIFNFINPEDRTKIEDIYKKVIESGDPFIDETTHRHSKGAYEVWESYYSPIKENNTTKGIAIYTRAITERKRNEEKLNAIHKERELLLNEIHHRVKNNLAVISSLLQLQIFNTSNKETIEILKSSQSKLRSTSLVHELLYQNQSLSKINLSQYVEKLSHDLQNTFYSDQKKIKIRTINNAKALLDIKRALPVSLLLNELITNAYKHGFKEQEKGEIQITVDKKKDELRLIIQDNGKGLPEDFNLAANTQTGISLIKTLVKQLKGTLTYNNENGAQFELTLNLD